MEVQAWRLTATSLMADNQQPTWSTAALPYLTKISHFSTPFITTFLLVHLSAPILANFGGSSLASQTLLLGREYYQTPFGEKYLVATPIILHSLSGISKRLLLSQSPSRKTPKQRPLTNLLSITAYSSLLIFLPIHVLTHRAHPADISPPILSVGPAQLDFEFVKLGLRTWPFRNWVLYAGLVCCVALHVAEGSHILMRTWLLNRWWPKLRPFGVKGKRGRAAAAVGGVVLPVLSGVFVMSREPLMSLVSLSERYGAAFRRSFVYWI